MPTSAADPRHQLLHPRDGLALLTPEVPVPAAVRESIDAVGFADAEQAVRRLRSVCRDLADRKWLQQAVPTLLFSLHAGADPDGSLVNFERFVNAVDDRRQLFRLFAERPRALEVLVKLFVGSQFLTEILLRNPDYLQRLTGYRRLAEFKSRNDFIEQGREYCGRLGTLRERMNGLRRYQQWELLRIAACDTFGLADLKTVTLQLSLLADALVQVALEFAAEEESLDPNGLAVLAFGKLGGEELNYSSDIDLVFIGQSDGSRYWRMAQKLIKALSDATELGFLYRVDMRLRPWGNAGALVTSPDAYVEYLGRQGQTWEKQALLKARPIAGSLQLGEDVLARLEPLVFDVDVEQARMNVRTMKQGIERQLLQKGDRSRDLKGGPGGIRDIEFVTQFLQHAYGKRRPEIRSRNTLDGLVRLAEAELIASEEFRRLSNGYVVLRTIEHALQLLHNKQEHALPRQERELLYLARRLDFPDAHTFLEHCDQHCRSVREIYERYVYERMDVAEVFEAAFLHTVDAHLGEAATGYREVFSHDQARQHLSLLDELDDGHPVRIAVRALGDDRWEVTVVGFDRLGDLSIICGLLFAYGCDIESGYVFTGSEMANQQPEDGEGGRQRKFVNVFIVRGDPTIGNAQTGLHERTWSHYEQELAELIDLARSAGTRESQGRLARRVAEVFDGPDVHVPTLLPVEVDIDNESQPDATVLHLRGEDTPGFLYELTNALAVSGISVVRVVIQSSGRQVMDTLHVVDREGRKIEDPQQQQALRAAIVLIKHFTHLLPHSPNPETALIHFQDFLEQRTRQADWLEQLSSLDDSQALDALARLLGVSEFLWEDFLKMQHENLFPVVTDVPGLQRAKGKEQLGAELAAELSSHPGEERRRLLNAFKDREMVRVDMRHILGLQDQFGMFSRELTDLAEVVVAAAWRICDEELRRDHGAPMLGHDRESRLAICGLGKFGGQELGYASDIELMFIYDADGRTAGPKSIPNIEYYQKLVDAVRKSIDAKRKGIFEVDLRLRPYGAAGSLAVSLVSFEKYFGPEGPAWPYERQALVKLRPVAGDLEFGRTIAEVRDSLIYRGEVFDVAAMRAMRERQLRQLVRAGSFNAKLSPGGLVDCEYLVQGLQISFGHLDAQLRSPNTREAMRALEQTGILSQADRTKLRDAYRFLRRLIDALRMVRGNASDLTVPPAGTDEFAFLARRLSYGNRTSEFSADLERHTANVLELGRLLDQLAGSRL